MSNRNTKFIRILITAFLILALSACSYRSNLLSFVNPTPETASANASETSAFSATATINPTQTPVPTATPSPTLEPSPTPTPHPMSIEAMRQMPYPGSEIVIERELPSGINYYRYYAYYLSEGLKIYGLLTIPYGEPPQGGWPAIIFNHGYIPPQVYRTTERYIAYVDWLARSQYIVYRIDYRGHDQSEGEASGAYGSPDYVIDVMNAVSSIQQFPAANQDKIGMWGHSMGGYLTLRAMVISPDIKAGVIWAGVVASYPDMLTRWTRATPNPQPTTPAFSSRWRQAWVDEFGSPEQNPEFWRSISANSYVNEISGPVQLHHGTLDGDVPLVFSELLWQELMDANQMVELYVYEGDDHNLSNYFSMAMARTLEFYDRYLKN